MPQVANSSRTLGLSFMFGTSVLVFLLSHPLYSLLPEPVPHTGLPYAVLHLIIELICIVVAMMAAAVGLEAYKVRKSKPVLFISVMIGAAGILNIGHALSYAGMPDFFTPNNPNKAIYFFMAVHMVTAFSLVGIHWVDRIFRGPVSRRSLGLITLLAVVAFFVAVIAFEDKLPPMFVKDHGLTSLKQILQGMIGITFTIGAVVNAWRGLHQKNRDADTMPFDFTQLAQACVLLAMSDIYFGLYKSVTDLYNFLGHAFTIAAFIFIYRGIFSQSVSKPYNAMADLVRSAQRANETKTQFLANVSHDFRTPLTVISGFCELLIASKRMGPQDLEWLAICRRNSDQLVSLIDDLLDITKIEKGMMTINKTWVNLDEILTDAQMSLKAMASKRNVVIEVIKEPLVPKVLFTDPVRLRQILNNIVSNAVKFTEHGKVMISVDFARVAESNDGTLFVTVTDTGMGISEKQKRKLFAPYERADEAHENGLRGTGLGLAISKNLAQAMGGDLWLLESTPGKGSTFCFRIRAKAGTVSSVATSKFSIDTHSSALEGSVLKGRSILVVDDSDDVRLLVSYVLENFGASVKQASNGLEALRIAKLVSIDLILMDVRMPEMNGNDAVKAMREIGLLIPILALTGNTLPSERTTTLSAGFDGYLIKPLHPDALVKAVHQALLDSPMVPALPMQEAELSH